jgi:hypothetical protein
MHLGSTESPPAEFATRAEQRSAWWPAQRSPADEGEQSIRRGRWTWMTPLILAGGHLDTVSFVRG